MKKFGFHKSERLKFEKEISDVFTKGKSNFNYPIKMYYHSISAVDQIASSPKIAISVPKKRIKKAHNRNTLKRRVREAYRLHSHDLKLKMIEANIQLHIVFVYIANDLEDYHQIEKAMTRCMANLSNLFPK